MAAAALALCSGDPKVLSGRIARSQDLLAELADHGAESKEAADV
jgi:hypothetical protein